MSEVDPQYFNLFDFPFSMGIDQYTSNIESLCPDSSFFPYHTLDNVDDYSLGSFFTTSLPPSPTEVPGTFPVFDCPASNASPTFKQEHCTTIDEQKPSSAIHSEEQRSTPKRPARRGGPRTATPARIIHHRHHKRAALPTSRLSADTAKVLMQSWSAYDDRFRYFRTTTVI
jgi:hypothetical protein